MKIYQFYVYIMATENNRVLYIGITNNLKRRVIEHREKLNPGYCSRYNLTKLVYYEFFQYCDKAISREKQLKEWRRAWKDCLIDKANPDWRDLTSSL